MKINHQGFTLLEVLVSITLISMIFVVLISGIFYGNIIKEKGKTNQKKLHDERYLNLYFQKQILGSDKIIIFANRVYLQDLESPQWYNYYSSSSNGLLRRYKASNDDNMTPIGAGGNSQFADNIKNFSMILESENTLLIQYTMDLSEKVFQREIRILHGRPIERK